MYKERAKLALEKTARQNRTCVEEVCGEINKTVQIGMASTDPEVQLKWRKIPCAGDYPSAEELVAFFCEMLTMAE